MLARPNYLDEKHNYFVFQLTKHLGFVHELADDLLLAVEVVIRQLPVKVARHAEGDEIMINNKHKDESNDINVCTGCKYEESAVGN